MFRPACGVIFGLLTLAACGPAAIPSSAPAAAAPGGVVRAGAAGAGGVSTSTNGIAPVALTASPPAAAPVAAGLQEGDTFVDFGLRPLDLETGTLGPVIWLSDFVGPGSRKAPKRLLLLNFFATWCGPCFTEMKLLSRWQEAYGPSGLQIVSLNFRLPEENADESMQKTRELLRGAGLVFPLLFDRYTQRNQAAYLGMRAALPSNVLIGEEGKVLLRTEGAAPTELERLEQVLRAELGIEASAPNAPESVPTP